MQKVIIALLIPVSMTFGYWIRGDDNQLEAELEGHVISNLPGLLLAVYSLEQDDLKWARVNANINLSNHLKYAVKYHGANTVEGFDKTRAVRLNAVANIWEKYPPVSPFFGQPESEEQWQLQQSRNYELLKWAKDQCARNPHYECRTHNKSLKPTQ
jgi:hypothetical protein